MSKRITASKIDNIQTHINVCSPSRTNVESNEAQTKKKKNKIMVLKSTEKIVRSDLIKINALEVNRTYQGVKVIVATDQFGNDVFRCSNCEKFRYTNRLFNAERHARSCIAGNPDAPVVNVVQVCYNILCRKLFNHPEFENNSILKEIVENMEKYDYSKLKTLNDIDNNLLLPIEVEDKYKKQYDPVENIKHLSIKTLKNICSNLETLFLNLLTHIHCDPNKPEYQNIRLNKTNNKVEIYDGVKWTIGKSMVKSFVMNTCQKYLLLIKSNTCTWEKQWKNTSVIEGLTDYYCWMDFIEDMDEDIREQIVENFKNVLSNDLKPLKILEYFADK